MIGLIVGFTFGLSAVLQAATSERVVSDHYTGLAIGGYDPVEYFIGGGPKQGRPEYELSYEGAVWRFRNEGNRAAFADNPRTYAPVFGGYDPVGIARGVSRPGHPELFAIVHGRLFLLFSEGARQQFLADPAGIVAEARQNWPAVQTSLVP